MKRETPKDRPLSMTGILVQATAEERKQRTRRVAKLPQDAHAHFVGATHQQGNLWRFDFDDRPALLVRCPYGQIGDRLWLKETWAPCGDAGARYYRAGTPLFRQGLLVGWVVGSKPDGVRWRPGRFMPRWASRFKVEITHLWPEPLQAISEEEARLEGTELWLEADPPEHKYCCIRHAFVALWDTVNAGRGFPWAFNPVVWVVGYKLMKDWR